MNGNPLCSKLSARVPLFCGPLVCLCSLLSAPARASEDSPLFPVDLGGPILSSPVVADIDLDGSDEILVGSDAGELTCLDRYGKILWQYATGGEVRSSPALADLDGDRTLEIVFQSEDGWLHVVDAQGAALPGWPRPLGPAPMNPRYTASPVLADLDGDGQIEIVTQAPLHIDGGLPYDTQRVWVFEMDGSILWTWERPWPGSGSFSAETSPAVADMDGDGILDVVTFFGITYHSPNGPGVGLYVLRGSDGLPWYENEIDIDGTRSSPSIGDINGDGLPDVIVSSWPPPYSRLRAITPATGELLWSIIGRSDVDNYSRSCPALGDINGDGLPEIIPGGSLTALDRNGWTIWHDAQIYSYNSSPVLGDIDGDDLMEVITADSANGRIMGYDSDGAPLAGFPLPAHAGAGIESTPILCDLDRDGDMEVLAGGTDGLLYWWETSYAHQELRMTWPGFRNDIRHAALERPVIDVDLTPDTIEAPPGGTVDLHLSLQSSSHRSQSVIVSLALRLKSGLERQLFLTGISLHAYASPEADISLAVPAKAPPGLQAWLIAAVTSPSSFEVDSDSTLVVIAGGQP